MIYLDTSAAAKIFQNESGREEILELLNNKEVVSSTLLKVELSKVWQRAGMIGDGYIRAIQDVSLIDITDEVVNRACGTMRVRPLDAIHLATASLLRDSGVSVQIATYDKQLRSAALNAGFEVLPKT